jgi:predicted acyl esterase
MPPFITNATRRTAVLQWISHDPIQNIRGRFKSEGQFVMQRLVRDKSNPESVDEGTDAYDTIDWLVKNVPNNNGRVGTWGISYPGWQAFWDLKQSLTELGG